MSDVGFFFQLVTILVDVSVQEVQFFYHVKLIIIIFEKHLDAGFKFVDSLE